MPLLHLTTNAPLSGAGQPALAAALSKAVSELIGKPEDYVMISLQPGTLLMGGTSEPAGFADVRSIGGLSPDVNRRLSERIGELLQEHLDIPRDRVYLNFTDVARTHWGWNGSTFG